jgi:hypothetical protein
LAIPFGKVYVRPGRREEAEKWAKNHSNVSLMARAEGQGQNAVILALHKDYSDYSDSVRELKAYWTRDIESSDRLLISLKGAIQALFPQRPRGSRKIDIIKLCYDWQ